MKVIVFFVTIFLMSGGEFFAQTTPRQAQGPENLSIKQDSDTNKKKENSKDSPNHQITKSQLDSEQRRLAACFMYSKAFGFEIDTIVNETLYRCAREWLNTPYAWGGRSKFGVDCSDFASVMYDSAYHIKVSGACGDIYADMNPVSKTQLREGDLVFFKIWGNGLSHVGIYLCHNKFVHASSGYGVIVSDLDEPYYKQYYFTAGRHKSL